MSWLPPDELAAQRRALRKRLRAARLAPLVVASPVVASPVVASPVPPPPGPPAWEDALRERLNAVIADRYVAAQRLVEMEAQTRAAWKRGDRAAKKLAVARHEADQVEQALASERARLAALRRSGAQLGGLEAQRAAWDTSRTATDWRPSPPPPRAYRTGAIVTTHGWMGAYAQSCIGSLVRFLPQPRHIVLFINEGTDPLFDTFARKFPEVDIVRVDDQEAFGGLTGTWNAGIERCLGAACDVVLLVNGDTHVEGNIAHLCDAAAAAERAGEAKVFGPVSNAPGPPGENTSQLSDAPLLLEPMESRGVGREGQRTCADLNGFFMGFPAGVLRKFRHDDQHVFDPAQPWIGNETGWWKTHCPRAYKDVADEGPAAIADGVSLWVVPRTFVYHHKHGAWRTGSAALGGGGGPPCCYQIITGGYEARPGFSPEREQLGGECYLLSDSPSTLRTVAIDGWVPLLIGPWLTHNGTDDPRRMQRCAKACPESVLPAAHDVTVYCDANMAPINWGSGIENLVLGYLPAECHLACWSHPRRTLVADEVRVVEEIGLETAEGLEAARLLASEAGFNDDVGLTATGMLLRRSGELQAFSEEWRELLDVCGRDQLVFDVLRWKHGVAAIRHPRAAPGTLVTKRRHDGPGSRARMAQEEQPRVRNALER